MFHSTTHFKNWIFVDEDELLRRRQNANDKFRSHYPSIKQNALTIAEETSLVNYYSNILKDFCRRFNPVMPRYVTSTALHYLKRFYLNNSVMEYHPKHIMVTCVYLAAKIEEFNVSMDQFVNNVKGDREKAADIVLNNELLLMHKLNYQLVIWHPYRSVEGFFIDIRTRYPACENPDKYRPIIDGFIDQCLSTDIIFILAPNQIALCALLYAADKSKDSIDK
ncbi:cyclin-H-like protein [Sarcoptes scabiei]|nr:cyclin-H-like protein [Sarcoptes scabiei]